MAYGVNYVAATFSAIRNPQSAIHMEVSDVKAGVSYGPMDIRVEEIERPAPGPGQVLLEVKAAGICGSDLHFHRRSPGETPKERRVMRGHEYSGEIVAVGEGVEDRRVGDRVGVEPLLGCGRCAFCAIGQYHLCPDLQHPSGGFHEHTVVPEEKAFLLPESMSYDEAAVLDCLAVGVHAVRQAGLIPPEVVAILGDGAVGISTLEVAKACGARRAILVGHHDSSLRIAERVGADATVNGQKEDPVQRTLELTDGAGADVVFETVGGTAESMSEAASIVHPGGRIVVVGSFTRSPVLDFRQLLLKEVDIRFSWSYAAWQGVPEFRIALDLLARGDLDARAMITHTYPLDRLSDAFQAALNKRESGALKVLVQP